MVEARAVGAEEFVELMFPGVAERGMADVVNQGEGFGEIGVESERARDGACDLRDL